MKLVKPYIEVLEDKDHYLYLLKKISDAGWTSTRFFPDYLEIPNKHKFIAPSERAKFIKKLIELGHESVLEHGTISVLIVADRGFLAEITRHRVGVAYTVESTRYCNYSKTRFHGQLCFVDPRSYTNMDEDSFELLQKVFEDAEWYYDALIEREVKPEIARAVLPQALVTHIYMTANIREWRYILKLRKTKQNHPLMQKIMTMLLDEFKTKYPIFFEDIT